MQIDLPQHRLIYEHIRGQIESGMLLPGDLLPSENELARIHQVARPTVRKALDRLVVDNFIQKQHKQFVKTYFT